MSNDHQYSQAERDAVYRAIFERRDMRHFIQRPVEEDKLQRLIDAACAAPSVGYMQPWRFIRIRDASLRKDIHRLVEDERIKTAKALNEREDEFMRLKVEGVLDCGELVVVAMCDQRERYIFGRRTMQHMDLASSACAIQNMWLAARAEGLGMGWVSLFDPQALAQLLRIPAGAEPIAVLCLGYVKEFYHRPMLELAQWDTPRERTTLIMDNHWVEHD